VCRYCSHCNLCSDRKLLCQIAVPVAGLKWSSGNDDQTGKSSWDVPSFQSVKEHDPIKKKARDRA